MKKSIFIKYIIVIFFFVNVSAFAQNPSEAPDDVDPTQTPINDYIIPMLLVGAALGYVLIKKKTQEA